MGGGGLAGHGDLFICEGGYRHAFAGVLDGYGTEAAIAVEVQKGVSSRSRVSNTSEGQSFDVEGIGLKEVCDFHGVNDLEGNPLYQQWQAVNRTTPPAWWSWGGPCRRGRRVRRTTWRRGGGLPHAHSQRPSHQPMTHHFPARRGWRGWHQRPCQCRKHPHGV